MRLRQHLSIAICAAAAVGCGADRVTAPDESARAAAELELAAAQAGVAAGPTGALTFQSAAAALRAGARVSGVDIQVGGVSEKWNAFAHEMELVFPEGGMAGDPPPPLRMRALLAWRATPSGMRVIHLVAEEDAGAVGDPLVDDSPELHFPAFLMYSEGRNLLWAAVRGNQTSSVTRGTTPCPAPRAPAATVQQQCVEASFTFGLSDVEARPFAIPAFGPAAPPPNLATGSRSLSMPPQTVRGVSVKLVLQRVAGSG